MARLAKSAAFLVVVTLAVLGAVAPVTAQTSGDPTGKIISGSIPADGGFGIIVYGGGTFDQLVSAAGCPVSRAVFWFTVNGNFVVFVPSTSVGAVNTGAQAAFPNSTIPASTPLIGRCIPAGLSGIQGTVTRGPICPVQRVRDPACADQPYQATIIFYNALVACPAFTCGEVSRTASGADGQYRVALAPGTYTVIGQNPVTNSGGFPRPPAPQTLIVPSGAFATVNLSFDTGIR